MQEVPEQQNVENDKHEVIHYVVLRSLCVIGAEHAATSEKGNH